jgi:hypothetical protein
MTTSTPSPSVKDRLQEMLLATDKFDPRTGELMARWADAFYTTMAARTGVSAQDLYRRFPLRVRSQDTASRPVMAGSSAEVKPSRADRKMDKAMIGRPRSSQTSSERVTDTPEFKRWFGRSQVVDGLGRPLVLYHGTGADFTEFRTDSELGAHFGTAGQAEERAPKYSKARWGGRLVPVYLSIKNPLRLRDLGNFHPQTVAAQLIDKGIKPKSGQGFKLTSVTAGEVRAALEEHGYDGIVYLNRTEGISPSVLDAIETEVLDGMFDDEALDLLPGAQDSYIAFRPEQIKSAMGNDGSFDRDDPSILSQSALEDSPAARSPLGLYSALAHHVASSPTRQATPAGWKQLIQGLINKGAVKADEVEWTGINDWLDLQNSFGGSSFDADIAAEGRMLSPAQRNRLAANPGMAGHRVTKSQLLRYLAQEGVRVEETVLGGASRKLVWSRWTTPDEDGDSRLTSDGYTIVRSADGLYDVYDKNNATLDEALKSEAAAKQVAELHAGSGGAEVQPRHGQWVLSGGENYREVLLTLPEKTSPNSDEAIAKWYEETYGASIEDDAGPDWREQRGDFLEDMHSEEREDKGGPATYRTTHWDQPNVLAHIRVNDRTDAEGKRVLFVEELQSDWGQEGKKNGFNPTKKTAPNLVINKIGAGFEVYNQSLGRTAQDEDGNDAIFENRRDAESMREQLLRDPYEAASGVPGAPFVTRTDAWLTLALKRVITMAAEGGYDKVAFVNGEQCVERFRLSHRISAIKWHRTPGGIRLHLSRSAPQGLGVLEDAGLHKATELPGIVGKEIAQAIVSSDERSGELTGLDLRVGGEGLRTFYDEVVPLTLKRLLNRLDPQSIGPVHFPGRLQIEERLLGFVIVDPQTKMYFRGGDSGRPWVEYPTNAKHFSSHTTARRSADAVDSPMGVNPSQPGFTLTPLLREIALQGLPLFQRQVQAKDATPRGTFNPHTLEIALGPKADASTWIHETGHLFLETLAEMASDADAPASVVQDMNRVLDWFGVQGTSHTDQAARSPAPDQETSGSTLHQAEKVLAPAGAVRLHDTWSVYQEKSCRFGDAHVRWIEDGDTAYIIDLQAPRNTRGREVVRGLAQLTGRSIHAVGVVDDAAGFWDRMEEEGLISGQTDENFVDFFGLRYRQSAREDEENEEGQEGREGREERPALLQAAHRTQRPHRTALQTWMDMTLEQKRPFHEQWARAMEQYVMEGKAPCEELRPVMEAFSAWLRAIYVSTRDFLDQAAGSLTKRTIRTSTRSSFGPSETLFRKALADQQAYTENPRAWFESRLHDVAQRLAALGVEAVMSGNGRPARFFSSDGEVPASGLTGQAGLLAKLYAQINAEYDAAETGRPPQFMPVGLDPDIELMPLTDRQRVVDLLTRGLRGELPVHAPLMQAPATPDPDPGPCRLTLTDDIRRVMDRLLSEQANSWDSWDEEGSATTDRRERMRA